MRRAFWAREARSSSSCHILRHPAPSPGLPCQFAAPNPPVVWAHCATGTESGVWRSTDGGANFTAVVSHGLQLPNSAAFAAASAVAPLFTHKAITFLVIGVVPLLFVLALPALSRRSRRARAHRRTRL